MNNNMKVRAPTTLEFALLGLIHAEPRSGYDLCKVFETTPMAHYSASPGAIYPALKRLEKSGLLVGQTERATSLRPRRVYRLAPEGQRILEDWVSRGVTREELVWGMEEMMLRFAFMGQLVPRKTVLRFLRELAVVVDELVIELESHHRAMLEQVLPGDVAPTGRLALWQGVGAYRELARWARQSVETLEQTRQSRSTS
jgi:DNA-binding PadR family transcriptional regulator